MHPSMMTMMGAGGSQMASPPPGMPQMASAPHPEDMNQGSERQRMNALLLVETMKDQIDLFRAERMPHRNRELQKWTETQFLIKKGIPEDVAPKILQAIYELPDREEHTLLSEFEEESRRRIAWWNREYALKNISKEQLIQGTNQEQARKADIMYGPGGKPRQEKPWSARTDEWQKTTFDENTGRTIIMSDPQKMRVTTVDQSTAQKDENPTTKQQWEAATKVVNDYQDDRRKWETNIANEFYKEVEEDRKKASDKKEVALNKFKPRDRGDLLRQIIEQSPPPPDQAAYGGFGMNLDDARRRAGRRPFVSSLDQLKMQYGLQDVRAQGQPPAAMDMGPPPRPDMGPPPQMQGGPQAPWATGPADQGADMQKVGAPQPQQQQQQQQGPPDISTPEKAAQLVAAYSAYFSKEAGIPATPGRRMTKEDIDKMLSKMSTHEMEHYKKAIRVMRGVQ